MKISPLLEIAETLSDEFRISMISTLFRQIYFSFNSNELRIAVSTEPGSTVASNGHQSEAK